MHVSNFEVLDVTELLSEVLKYVLLQRSMHAFALSNMELFKAGL